MEPESRIQLGSSDDTITIKLVARDTVPPDLKITALFRARVLYALSKLATVMPALVGEQDMHAINMHLAKTEVAFTPIQIREAFAESVVAIVNQESAKYYVEFDVYKIK